MLKKLLLKTLKEKNYTINDAEILLKINNLFKN